MEKKNKTYKPTTTGGNMEKGKKKRITSRLKSAFSLPVMLAALLSSCTSGTSVIVSNDSGLSRKNEVVEIAKPQLKSMKGFVIKDSKNREIPYQILANGNIAIPVSVDAHKKAVYRIAKGQPSAVDTLLAWTFREDCQDDFAWENEHAGFRLYGPSYKDKGGMVHGYDIWCKRDTLPIVERLYDLSRGPKRITFHKDHGEGFDGYTVGPTLGAGSSALVCGDSILYSTAYRTFEVVDFGPLRLAVRFVIDGMSVNGSYVQETRTLTLDRGAHFNKVSSLFNGLKETTPVISGVVVHADNPEGYALMPESGAVAVVDHADDRKVDNGDIYIAAIVPDASKCEFMPVVPTTANAIGHVVVKSAVSPGIPYVYYFGSGWSKNTVRSQAEWERIIKEHALKIKHPLKVSLR